MSILDPQPITKTSGATLYVAPRGKTTTGPAAPLPALNVKDYGAKGDGVTDDVVAIRAAAAAGNHLYFPPGNYIVSSVADNTALLTFTGQDGVIIDAAEATLTNNTEYTADTITPMFKLDACKNVTIRLKKYVGFTLATPETHLGYRGATLVYAINGTDGVRVDATITNARYGVLTGSYSTPSLGGCKNFDLRLRGSMVGYSLAAYLAKSIRHEIDVDGVHRAGYIAGCNDVKGSVRYKDLYIAPIAYLITDALTTGTDAAAQADPVGAATGSAACTNVDVTVEDKGSSVFTANGHVAGISLSRVDPVAFRNIRARVYLQATNTLSTTMHGFSINSTAKSIWSRYANNWEPTVLLDNIEVGGVIDKSALTVAGYSDSNGFLTIRTDDPANTAKFATIRNFRIRDLLVRSGTTGGYLCLLLVRGLATPMTIDGLVVANPSGTTDGYVGMAGSTTQPVIFNQCMFGTLETGSVAGAAYIIGPGTAITAPDVDQTMRLAGGTVRGAGPRLRSKMITATGLTGATVTLAGAIPAGATDVRVQARVITAITGATGFQIGVTGDLTKYADVDLVAAGTVVNPAQHAATAYTAPTYAAATDLLITGKTAAFTAGAIRIFVHYWEYPNIAS